MFRSIFPLRHINNRQNRRQLPALPCRPCVEVLEDRLTPSATVSLSNGLFKVTESAAVNATISQPNSSTLKIVLAGDTFAASGSTNGITGFNTSTLTITTSVATFTDFNLQTAGAVAVSQGTNITASGSISLTGTGDATAPVGVSITSSSLRGGNITLNGVSINGGTSNAEYGVYLGANTVISSSGNISISGTSRGWGSYEDGVTIAGGSQVTAAGSGTITINGTASSNGVNSNIGINISDASTVVSTVNGQLEMVGGGYGSGSWNYGIGVQAGAVVQSTGTGAVELSGEGVSGAGSMEDGIFVYGAYVRTLNGGSVSLEGYGNGWGSGDCGVTIAAASQVSAAGTGTVYIDGQGSEDATNSNMGVNITDAGTIVGTVSGNLTIVGVGAGSFTTSTGTGSWNYGIGIQANALVQSTSVGAVSLTGTTQTNGTGAMNDGIYIGTASVTANYGGSVTLNGTAGVGTGNSDTGVVITSHGSVASSSAVSITGMGKGSGSYEDGVTISGGAVVSGGTSGSITIQGNSASLGNNSNIGVNITDQNTFLSTQAGNLRITGVGTGWGSYNYGIGIEAHAMISSAGGAINLNGSTSTNGSGTMDDGLFISSATVTAPYGAITLQGTAARATGNNNNGIVLTAGASVSSSSVVTISGTGNGTGNNEYGVTISSASTVYATGNGTIIITGIGSSIGLNANFGVNLTDAGSLVTSQNGNITIVGAGGCTNGSGSWNYGIGIQAGASVSATGSGKINLTGTGYAGTGSMNDGVFLCSGTVQTNLGSVFVFGNLTGTSSGSYGVALSSYSYIVARFSGSVMITGSFTAGSLTDVTSQVTAPNGVVSIAGLKDMSATYNSLNPGDPAAYAPDYGTLFGSNGPVYTDVHQGVIGDCWLMASLAEVAAQQPSIIQSMFTWTGTAWANNALVGTYLVRLYNILNQPIYVPVDTELPGGGTADDQPVKGVMWAALAEKAYAEANGFSNVHSEHEGVLTYSALNNGYAEWALQAISASPASNFGSKFGDATATMAAGVFNGGGLVVLNTGSPPSGNVVPTHCYALVGYNAGSSLPFEIFNPWGIGNDGGNINYWDIIWANADFVTDNFDSDSLAGSSPKAEQAAHSSVAAPAFVTASLIQASANSLANVYRMDSAVSASPHGSQDQSRGSSDSFAFAQSTRDDTISEIASAIHSQRSGSISDQQLEALFADEGFLDQGNRFFESSSRIGS